MKTESLKQQIEQLRKIADGWSDGEEISSLEMDMALDRVKRIYEILRFGDDTPSRVGLVASVVSDTMGSAVDEVVDQIAESAIGLVEYLESDPAEAVIEEVVEETVGERLEEVAEEVAAPLNKRERYNRIRSLYGDETEVEETPAPAPEPTPAPIVESTLTPAPPRQPMSMQLTINDRFLLSHDLFGDDMEALNATLEQLDALTSFDEALIYIAENYSWNSSSGGAQIMIALLKSRFNVK